MRKLKSIALLAVVAIFVSSFTACSGDDPEPDPNEKTTIAKQTILMFLPYTDTLGSNSCLYGNFVNNIRDFESAITNNGGLGGNKLLVFISKDATTSYLININYKDGACQQDTLETLTFTELDYTTADGIKALLNDVKTYAPAKNYAMTIGCHGAGWLPVTSSSKSVSRNAQQDITEGSPLIRWYGGIDNKYQTDIETLADGIASAGIKLSFICFDCCYMSNIEVAYSLRNVADYLIASTCEVMAKGMPYDELGMYMFNNDYENICQSYRDFYSTYTKQPYGTIAVTDLNEVEDMAILMKEINDTYPEGLTVPLYQIQKLDGYGYTIFFDFGDYVDKLCLDEDLKQRFNNVLSKLVIAKGHTENFISYMHWGYYGTPQTINTFSGLTISDPTINFLQKAKYDVVNTAWYKATH